MTLSARVKLGALAAGLLLVTAIPTPVTAEVSDPDQVQAAATEMFCIIRSADAACYHGAAQTFTVGAAGYLTHVMLPLTRNAMTTADLVVEIRADTPAGALLAASEPVPPEDIPVGGYGDDDPPSDAEWVVFTLATPVPVTIGDTLAIVIPPEPLDAEPSYWGWASASTDVYDGGARWGGSALGGVHWGQYIDRSDLAFVTYVQLPVTRIAGADRYETAVRISEVAHGPGVPVAFVATGLNFPDALAGAAAAGHRGAPLLLVRGTAASIPALVADELDYLDPDRIVILGGTGAVSSSIATELRAYSPIVRRLSGVDRYATAVAISKWTYPAGDVDEVFVATGLAFADALAAAAVAGRDDAPLLLVPGTAPGLATVPTVKTELVRLNPGKVVIVGGAAAVSRGIKSDIAKLLPSADVVRISGPDRYATAAAISKVNFAAGQSEVYVATGMDFPDALAGAALAGLDEAPLLLVPGTKSDLAPYDVIEAELTRLGPSQIVIFGGPGAVSPGLAADLKAFVVE